MLNATPSAETAGPCAGMLVVDMSSLISGPYCGQVLADLGAEVIKIESAGSDIMRLTQPQHGALAAAFEHHNRGKKSVVVDLKSDEGRDKILRLARGADFFLQNSRPGVMERLGFGYEDLRKTNPRLIYVSISGFGETGDYANLAAYDTVIQGVSGFMEIQGGDGNPTPVRAPVADRITGIWASNAALAAALHRERTGEGQKVSVNMIRSFSSLMLPDAIVGHTFRSVDPGPIPSLMGVYETLETSDGRVIGIIQQRPQIERLCKALSREDLLDDPRFATGVSLIENVVPLYHELAKVTRSMTTAELLDLAASISVPFGKVNSIDDFLSDPHLAASETYVDFHDEEFGTIRHLNHPAIYEKSPANARRRAPKLGEHSDEI